MATRILLAPDSFKGTFPALDVARALAAGVESVGAIPDVCPVADGGEGTLDVLLAARGGELVTASAHDPLGRPIEAAFALLADGTAVVETAAASGVTLVAEDERDAERAWTTGTGELLVAAARTGAATILLGVGGSASTDGGAGALAAIEAAGGLGAGQLVLLCDVATPFEDAAEVFAPQKGADAVAVTRLGARLALMAQQLPRDPRGVPMTGAAGGLAGGLWAALGAELRPGASAVLDAIGLAARLAAADALIAGEGRVDGQSLEGKVVGELAARARAAGVPLHVVAGVDGLEPEDRMRLGAASVREAPTLAALETAGAQIASTVVGRAVPPAS